MFVHTTMVASTAMSKFDATSPMPTKISQKLGNRQGETQQTPNPIRKSLYSHLDEPKTQDIVRGNLTYDSDPTEWPCRYVLQ